MSKIARRLTGLTKKQLIESDFKIASSAKDIYYPKNVPVRGNPRFSAGLITGSEDREKRRKKL